MENLKWLVLAGMSVWALGTFLREHMQDSPEYLLPSCQEQNCRVAYVEARGADGGVRRWQISEHPELQRLVGTLSSYDVSKKMTGGSGMEGFGINLNSPSFVVGYEDGSTDQVFIGQHTPVGYNLYLKSSRHSGVRLGGRHLELALSRLREDERFDRIH